MHTAPTEISTLSLHDALPIFVPLDELVRRNFQRPLRGVFIQQEHEGSLLETNSRDSSGNILDRKSTRLNSSHRCISYAVFCLKKKKKTYETTNIDNHT